MGSAPASGARASPKSSGSLKHEAQLELIPAPLQTKMIKLSTARHVVGKAQLIQVGL